MSSNSNILKRKNEDADSNDDDSIKKRVALDNEQLEASLKPDEANESELSKDDDPEQSSPVAQAPVAEAEAPVAETTDAADEYDPTSPAVESTTVVSPADDESGTSGSSGSSGSSEDEKPEEAKEAEKEPESVSFDSNPHISEERKHLLALEQEDDESSSLRDTLQREEDPTLILLRMYCPTKEAGIIVGKKGESINHIRDKANVKVFISENLKEIPERIVTVKGSAENVAKAFGLMIRTILDEPEDEPSNVNSRSYDLRLLVPHPMVGFIIGKQGSKFREIEENSAAKLKAAETPMPFSTDRILVINGVSDAIHIAVYYVAQTWLEHRDILQQNKVVQYSPTNYQPNLNPATTLIAGLSGASHVGSLGGSRGSLGNANNMGNGSNMNTMNALSALNSLSSMMMPNNNPVPQQYNSPLGANAMLNNQMAPPIGAPIGAPLGAPMGNNGISQSPYSSRQPYNSYQPVYQQGSQQNYNAPPNYNNQSNYGSQPNYNQPNYNQPNYNQPNYNQPNYNNPQGYNSPRQNQPMNVPPQQSYTDEHGNNMVGEVLTTPPVPAGSPDKFNQDVFVANHSIGSVIGKGGNNIKQIRETSGCTYVKIEPDRGQTMMLGGGKGLVNMRKLTLTGAMGSINTAIYLINQRINSDKERNVN